MWVEEEEEITGTETTRGIEKHIPTAVSISSNLRPDTVVLSSSNPRELLLSFADALENLATEAKTQKRAQLFEAANSINSKLSRLLETLNGHQSNQEAIFPLRMSVAELIQRRGCRNQHNSYECKSSN